ncbi:alpha/beta hydrolase [Moraxella pluranimalium]|nr:alpha/beta hydrolase [Moraxella pluranimalium]
MKFLTKLLPFALLASSWGVIMPATAAEPYSKTYYKQKEVYPAVTAHSMGEGAQRVYVFLPTETPAHVNTKMPVVFLHHGWLGMNPMNFGALIDHLARSGHAVIYPVYQESEATNPATITKEAVDADKRALTFLQEQGYTIDPDRVMYVGFSMGSAISLNIALDPTHFGLPKPKGMVLMNPGDAHHVKKGEQAKSIISDISHFPTDIPIVVMSGEGDTSIGLPTARKIASKLCHLPNTHRSLLILPSDSHAGKTVKSGHGSAGSPDFRYNFELTSHDYPKTLIGREEFEDTVSLNQLDFHGFWRAIVDLNDSLAHGSPVVLGAQGAKDLPLGAWDDGTPFKPMRVETPCK